MAAEIPDGTLRAFLDGLMLPAWVIDCQGELTFVNEAWSAFTGDAPAKTLEDGLFAQIQHKGRARLRLQVEAALSANQCFESEFQLRRADGQFRWMACFVSACGTSKSGCTGLAGVCIDLTEHRDREEQLAFMATHDALTGLPNRRMFESSLARAVERARRGVLSALLVIDIDNFKFYNDSLGHLAGDQALINFSLLLQRHVRSGDLLARIGGDEFAVLLEQTAMTEATEIAQRMRIAARTEEFVTAANEHDLGMSAGLVTIDGTLSSRDAFELADEAMYAAKEAGRDRVEIRTETQGGNRRDTERIAGRVRRALTEHDFVLHYQPVINLHDNSVSYFEALVRMLDDDRVLMPAEFLPTVERLGLMPRLTRLIVSMSVRALADNPAARVSVNLSRGDLADDSLPRFVDEELRQQEVEPSRLVFEMSEDAAAGNLASARNWIDRLGRLGCQFALDEFGAGLGIFGLLRELPFNQVKLDGSIITALSSESENAAFVEAVRGLIESQGHIAVASWVENADMLSRVKAAGFELGQGYHLEMPSASLSELVRRLG